MSTLADRTIAALRATHDELSALVAGLTDDQLDLPSGAAKWDVAQVLSHLGSSAEIALAGLQAGLVGEPPPDQSFNQAVWDRWNALSQREKADGYLAHGTALVEAFESTDAQQRADLTIAVAFLPHPLGLGDIAGMRLHEAAMHGWDVGVALDPDATVATDTAEVLIEQFLGGQAFMLGFIGKADALGGRKAELAVQTSEPARSFGLVVDSAVSLAEAVDDPTGSLTAPAESVIRLLAGRLKPEHTPEPVAVTGDVTLDDLRRVFPGY